MADKISMQYYTPKDANGNRTAIFPITSSDEVIVNPESSTASTTLTDKIDQIETIQVQAEQPDFACIWAKPIED